MYGRCIVSMYGRCMHSAYHIRQAFIQDAGIHPLRESGTMPSWNIHGDCKISMIITWV